LPAVVTADLRLNQPRHASLPNIMKAKKKPIETLSSQDVGLSADTRVTVLETRAPQPRAKGVRVTDVDELISRLRDDAKIV
jgi:electron transfer flavoprotein beta subunit